MLNKPIILTLGVAAAKPQEERVTSLPDYPEFSNFEMYSGYTKIEGTTKEIHYLLNTSQGNPDKDPLLIWFNGGPGCSSMNGWGTENGPFLQRVEGDQTFTENPYSWNKFANVLYIEQPAGVGFSICGNKRDCTFDDDSFADDNLQALLGFYEKYPEFKKNDLYVTGESYAGIYAPFTANRIYDFNKTQHNKGLEEIPLKGFIVGNGITNWKYDADPARIQTIYDHSIITQETKDQMDSNNCDYSGDDFGDDVGKVCEKLYDQFAINTDKLFLYNIFKRCEGLPDDEESKLKLGNKIGTTVINGELRTYKRHFTQADYTPWAFKLRKGKNQDDPTIPFDCTNGNAFNNDYLNREDVRKALHISDKVHTFIQCKGEEDGWFYSKLRNGSQWVYERLKGEIRMMHFSGDIDGVVPTQGTQGWIKTMNRKVLEEWRPYFFEGNLAGYTEEYDGLTFATVHKSGHMVPQDQPGIAFHLISKWLKNEKI